MRCARTAQAVRHFRAGTAALAAGAAALAAGAAALAAGAKRKGHPWFPFLFELLPFLLRAWVQMVDFVSRKRSTAEDFFFRVVSAYSHFAYRTATQVGYSTQARHKVNCPKGKRRYSEV